MEPVHARLLTFRWLIVTDPSHFSLGRVGFLQLKERDAFTGTRHARTLRFFIHISFSKVRVRCNDFYILFNTNVYTSFRLQL
jgi:hypothetical protein